MPVNEKRQLTPARILLIGIISAMLFGLAIGAAVMLVLLVWNLREAVGGTWLWLLLPAFIIVVPILTVLMPKLASKVRKSK